MNDISEIDVKFSFTKTCVKKRACADVELDPLMN
jgi:hypothetical protein